MVSKLIEQIKNDEGFKAYPYIDPLVKKYPEKHGIPKNAISIIEKYLPKLKLTVGYGTLLPISKEEGEMLLDRRLNNSKEIEKVHPFFSDLPDEAKEILLNMAYNMGVPKLMKFKKMWKALENRDYREASKEMINSNWYRQVGQRANELVLRMSAIE